jgi:hypothetical protein
MSQLGRGRKDPDDTAGAPFPPATEHSDGPERPRRDVPTAGATADEPDGDNAETPPDEEESR